MNRHEVGKIASAVTAAAVPALGALIVRQGASMLQNRLQQKSKPAVQKSSVRTQVLRSAPVQLAFGQPKMGFKSAAPTKKGASARIVGCDYIGVYGSSPTTNTFLDYVFSVTPRSSVTFPRMNALATAFELYSFNKCRFVAVGIAASTQAGSMSLAPDLYPDGDSYTAAEIRNEEGQVTKKMWETATMDYPCDRATRPWFLTDNGNVATDEDSKLGDFHLGIDGITPLSLPICDLFVEYDIEFAQCQSIAGNTLLSDALHRVLRLEGGREAIEASVLALLPETERKAFDSRGNRLKQRKQKESSEGIMKALGIKSVSVTSDQIHSQPIPAAALRARLLSQAADY